MLLSESLPYTANTTGSFNTAVGSRSLFSNTTGIENTALGQGSLYSNTNGTYTIRESESLHYTLTQLV